MKKNFFKLMAVTLMLSIVFVSCKKDNTDKKTQFSYDGTDYALSNGYSLYFSLANPDPASYNFYLMLLSPEVTFDYLTTNFTGVGDGILIMATSSSISELVPGTYTYDAGGTGVANTFAAGIMLIDYDFSSGLKTSTTLSFTEGTLTVAKSGSDYELDFDGTITGGKKLTFYYKGVLEYHDLSSSAKSLMVK